MERKRRLVELYNQNLNEEVVREANRIVENSDLDIEFIKIAALINLEEYEEAKRNLDLITGACDENEYKQKYAYLLGTLYSNTGREFLALETFYRAKQELKNCNGINFELLITELEGSIFKLFRNQLKDFQKITAEKEKEFSEHKKIKLAINEIYTRFSITRSFFLLPGLKKGLPFDQFDFCYSEKENDVIRFYYVEQMNICNATDLVAYQRRIRVNPKIEYVVSVLEGCETDLDYENMDVQSIIFWKLTSLFVRAIFPILPNAKLEAWDVNEMVGNARLMYSAGLIEEKQLMNLYESTYFKVKNDFSSWEQYAISMALGAIYYRFIRSYDLDSALQFGLDVFQLAVDEYKKWEWI